MTSWHEHERERPCGCPICTPASGEVTTSWHERFAEYVARVRAWARRPYDDEPTTIHRW